MLNQIDLSYSRQIASLSRRRANTKSRKFDPFYPQNTVFSFENLAQRRLSSVYIYYGEQ